MAIPIATTTISIHKVTSGPYEQEVSVPIASGINADIQAQGGSEASNQRTDTDIIIYCDLIPQKIPNTGYVINEKTDERFEINFSLRHDMAGTVFDRLSHIEIHSQVTEGSIQA